MIEAPGGKSPNVDDERALSGLWDQKEKKLTVESRVSTIYIYLSLAANGTLEYSGGKHITRNSLDCAAAKLNSPQTRKKKNHHAHLRQPKPLEPESV